MTEGMSVMKLTRTADFALKIIVYLATTKKLTTMPILSKELNIPYHNMSKLIQKLAKAQLVQTIQGKGGGIRLLQKPNKISIKTVLDLIDGPTNMADCIANASICKSKNCKVKVKLSEIQTKIESILAETKMSDMI